MLTKLTFTAAELDALWCAVSQNNDPDEIGEDWESYADKVNGKIVYPAAVSAMRKLDVRASQKKR